MEQKFSSLDRVMEPDTISKNGASLKSHTSKRNFMLFAILAVIAGFFAFSSCYRDVPYNEPYNEPSGGGGGGTTTLSAPRGVSLTRSGNSINISWNKVSGATSYSVYWGANSSEKTRYVVQNTSSTSTTDNYPVNGNNYYWVKAFNNTSESNFSGYSAYLNFSSGGNGGGGGGGGTTTPCQASYVGGNITLTTLTVYFNFPCTLEKIRVEAYKPKTGQWVALNSNISGSATSYSISPYRDYVTEPVQYGLAKVRVSGYRGGQWGSPKVVVFDIGWGKVYRVKVKQNL